MRSQSIALGDKLTEKSKRMNIQKNKKKFPIFAKFFVHFCSPLFSFYFDRWNLSFAVNQKCCRIRDTNEKKKYTEQHTHTCVRERERVGETKGIYKYGKTGKKCFCCLVRPLNSLFQKFCCVFFCFFSTFTISLYWSLNVNRWRINLTSKSSW